MVDLINLTADEIKEAYASGCAACLQIGSGWVHLRICLDCRTVGCCDDSPRKHAGKHWQDTGHEVVQSLEPGESWRWNYAIAREVE